uniref:Uncharacterized protein n=1 Tax=Aegilops tauschii subsp. strangulata TaxID=200361 RepID=A0A453P0B0_AEGTS
MLRTRQINSLMPSWFCTTPCGRRCPSVELTARLAATEQLSSSWNQKRIEWTDLVGWGLLKALKTIC